MFELGRINQWWEVAKKHPSLSRKEQTLKPLGYAHMVNLIEAFKPKRVLEVGHGAGSYLFDIFSDKIEFWGLDDTIEDNAVTADSLAETKKTYPNVRFVTGLLGQNNPELPDNYFDLVCSVSVLEHIPHEHLDAVFKDTYRILRPGGIVSHSYDIAYRYDTSKVFSAYESNGFEWLKPRHTMNVFWDDRINEYDKESLLDAFERVMVENPMMVTEKFLWQIPREKRHTPLNYFTVLNAGFKPSEPGNTSNAEADAPTPDTFDQYCYSRRSHFKFFNDSGTAQAILGSIQSPDSSDVRNYQTMLAYSYIKNNLKAGESILEIGNQTPHVLNQLKSEYACTELLTKSKPELLLAEEDAEGIELMHYDPAANDLKLPAENFDLIFSLSIIKGEQLAGPDFSQFLNVVMQSLKTGGALLLCFTTIWKDPVVNFDDLHNYIFESGLARNEFVQGIRLATDRDIFFISKEFYEEKWMKHIGKGYRGFGKPFSANILVTK